MKASILAVLFIALSGAAFAEGNDPRENEIKNLAEMFASGSALDQKSLAKYVDNNDDQPLVGIVYANKTDLNNNTVIITGNAKLVVKEAVDIHPTIFKSYIAGHETTVIGPDTKTSVEGFYDNGISLITDALTVTESGRTAGDTATDVKFLTLVADVTVSCKKSGPNMVCLLNITDNPDNDGIGLNYTLNGYLLFQNLFNK